MQVVKEARWWLESKSSLWHVGFIVLLYVVFGLAVVVAAAISDSSIQASKCVIEILGYCVKGSFLDIFSGDAKKDYPTLSMVVGIGNPILTIIATSLMTISLLRDTGRIVVSENACVYEPATLYAEKSTIKSSCLVFRMMNRGGKFIFDVNVSVVLRFVGDDNESDAKTFRFFPLKVLGAEGQEGAYPLLESKFPFRVYVRLDQEVQSAVYLGALSCSLMNKGQSLAEVLAVIDRDTKTKHSGNTRESAILVSVRGKDSISGKDVVTSAEYHLTKIKAAKFADIALQDFIAADAKTRMDDFNRISETV